MESIKNRTTIRKYSNREVSDELLHRLIEEAERTPTMGNLQLYSVVVTRSKEGKKALAPAHFNQPMVTDASVVLTICADYRRTTIWAENRKGTPGYDNILSFMNAATDALLFTQTFCNLAEEEGLGTCFLGTTIYMPKMIIDTLKLPKLVMPVATITLGWPDEHPAKSDRLPLRSIIHQESYSDYRLHLCEVKPVHMRASFLSILICPSYHASGHHASDQNSAGNLPYSPQVNQLHLSMYYLLFSLPLHHLKILLLLEP